MLSILLRRAMLALALSASPALAADSPPARVHGVVKAVSGTKLELVTAEGAQVTAELGSQARITAVRRASFADIRPGTFVGAAALPGPDGTLRALEVHIFPDSMRGTGEGHRPMDPVQNKTMTNGTVGVVGDTRPDEITIAYAGGNQRVLVGDSTPVVGLEPADASLLRPGAKVIAIGHQGSGNTLVADRILVGRDGLDPPM